MISKFSLDNLEIYDIVLNANELHLRLELFYFRKVIGVRDV